MNDEAPMLPIRVADLYVHGPRGTRPEDLEPTPMQPIESVFAERGLGLKEDARYFKQANPGVQRKRQVSLIDEGTVWRLERDFGPIPRQFIKSQIFLEGAVDLPGMIGSVLSFSSGAEIVVALPRRPCYAMDLIGSGLRVAMENGNQGVLGMVVESGTIANGDAVVIRPSRKVGEPPVGVIAE